MILGTTLVVPFLHLITVIDNQTNIEK